MKQKLLFYYYIFFTIIHGVHTNNHDHHTKNEIDEYTLRNKLNIKLTVAEWNTLPSYFLVYTPILHRYLSIKENKIKGKTNVPLKLKDILVIIQEVKKYLQSCYKTSTYTYSILESYDTVLYEKYKNAIPATPQQEKKIINKLDSKHQYQDIIYNNYRPIAHNIYSNYNNMLSDTTILNDNEIMWILGMMNASFKKPINSRKESVTQNHKQEEAYREEEYYCNVM